MLDWMQENVSPLTDMDCSFANYVQKRTREESVHMLGNAIPDYAFGLDYETRKGLDSIPHLYSIAKKVTATYASRTLQQINRGALAVGPNQLPEVYAISCDCARILGIGIPNIYIVSNPEVNAFTVACDDIEPLIVIYSGLYERYSLEELRMIIGHECGHIHNHHTTYDYLANALLLGGEIAGIMAGMQNLIEYLTAGARMALLAWSRAAEVTCDRAGMICSNHLEDAYRAMAMLMYGGAKNVKEIDFQSIREQLSMQTGNIMKYEELFGNTHPAVARRIAAMMEFGECETLYSWRPELKTPGQALRSKADTEERCRKLISVVSKK